LSTVKAELHRLIDSLSEYQASKLKKVISLVVVEFMPTVEEPSDKDQAVLKAFMNAAEDDEELSAEELSAIAAADEDIKAGRVRSLAEVVKELRL